MSESKNSLMEMLTYKRPEGSVTQKVFCRKFLEPVFGEPDEYGNYIHTIPTEDGLNPEVLFAAHHDTVHLTEGLQQIVVSGDMVKSTSGECLGADCTTGVWLILEMIEGKVPGVYVVHAAEESGCLGSAWLVQQKPDWLTDVKAVISFDRYAVDSVITHQMGRRTASETFARSLESILMMGYVPDSGGSYTDSNEYIDVVGECTNISVGYYDQHTKKESQDMKFAYDLRDALLCADWSKLKYEREPGDEEYDDFNWLRGWGRNTYTQCGTYDETAYDRPGDGYPSYKTEVTDMEDMIRDWPDLVAAMLADWGFDAQQLYEAMEEFGHTHPDFVNEGAKRIH